MMVRRGFSLTEIMIICVIVGVIATAGYKVLSGVLGHFGKSQTKLTNLRMANVVIEWLKSDVRASVVPTNSEAAEIEKNKCSFFMAETGDESSRKKVSYVFEDNSVTREFNGKKRNLTGDVKITDLSFIEVKDEKTGGKFLKIEIVVDRDKDLEDRTESNKHNVVKLETVLYPKFYEECLSVEEHFWTNARRSAAKGS